MLITILAYVYSCLQTVTPSTLSAVTINMATKDEFIKLVGVTKVLTINDGISCVP
jgi:hypothetical protein